MDTFTLIFCVVLVLVAVFYLLVLVFLPYVGLVLFAGILLLGALAWFRDRWEPHIYRPGKFEPPLYRKIGFIAILRGTPATDPILGSFAKALNVQAYETPEGIVLKFGKTTQPFPNIESALSAMRRLLTEHREAAELRKPAEKAAAEERQRAEEERQRAKKERAEKRRPIKQLAFWYALCWIVVAVWIRLLGGPHGDFSGYFRARAGHFFWWDSFEVTGIVWFATTFVYALLGRAKFGGGG